MSNLCEKVRGLLVDGGPVALQDDEEAQAHLVDCSHCFAFLEALQEVDDTLANMPLLDAPEAPIEAALKATRKEEEQESPEPLSKHPITKPKVGEKRGPHRSRRWFWRIAAVAGTAMVPLVLVSTLAIHGMNDMSPMLAPQTVEQPAEEDARLWTKFSRSSGKEGHLGVPKKKPQPVRGADLRTTTEPPGAQVTIDGPSNGRWIGHPGGGTEGSKGGKKDALLNPSNRSQSQSGLRGRGEGGEVPLGELRATERYSDIDKVVVNQPTPMIPKPDAKPMDPRKLPPATHKTVLDHEGWEANSTKTADTRALPVALAQNMKPTSKTSGTGEDEMLPSFNNEMPPPPPTDYAFASKVDETAELVLTPPTIAEGEEETMRYAELHLREEPEKSEETIVDQSELSVFEFDGDESRDREKKEEISVLIENTDEGNSFTQGDHAKNNKQKGEYERSRKSRRFDAIPDDGLITEEKSLGYLESQKRPRDNTVHGQDEDGKDDDIGQIRTGVAADSKEKEKLWLDGVLPDARLRTADVLSIVRGHRRAIRTCLREQAAEDPLLEGKMKLKLQIQRSGSVKVLGVSPAKFRTSYVGQCVANVAKGWSFPSSSEPMTLSLPIRVRADLPAGTEEATRLLRQRNQTEGLRFKEAAGYWANTYLPGDPAFRLLQAKLEQKPHLSATARQYTQPFDKPLSSAMAVYLHADRSHVDGKQRMLLQVGLQGTPLHGRRRPSMNIGLVWDARSSFSEEEARSLRALIASFSEAHEIGDRFSLTVAGRAGGMIVPADNFEYGPVEVAIQKVLNSQPGSGLDLLEAVRLAHASVRGGDDETTPLGASSVVIITTASLPYVQQLVHLAHKSAVDGNPVSIIGVGNRVVLSELDSIALAGQGNRRLLTSSGDARALVDRELSAVSRVVARAVRLRIQLKPGVQLVDVLGSHRLDEVQAERVRKAEQSIDRRLSRNLGIDADRGKDEAGIQIVIPTYYADDAHVILLDVVVPGPGPVADVQLRFKDLAYLKNGVARTSLSVARGKSAPGPLERSVLKNLVAYRISKLLGAASDSVENGQTPQGAAAVAEARLLLSGLMRLISGWANDRDLTDDLRMLAAFEEALRNDSETLIADALEYARLLKLLPRPLVSE